MCRPENEQAIELIDDWFAKQDDLGEEFWAEYEEDLKREYSNG